ncbi:CRISPR-associated protein, Cas5d family [Sphingomonas guangdongensis]|uniref:CRISPR-associated protein, Cas5d family n=1 Tax=Sphingomonas guangdongensis TaxID=1141890 RepID=A0A285QGY0_9SPHN|nr:type I-C CRISPR-associated protein Cas5c [Sphingomonas guangdongensis]SOB80724.1 CRISPR-associated protein, Cas5d family [Sphingomonas guangdongensis]
MIEAAGADLQPSPTSKPFTLRVTGERAFFPRPEFRLDRVSFDVITPRAARGIFDAIHWRPSIRWTVERIRINAPIVRRTLHQGAGGGAGRTVILVDVDYSIDARLTLLSGRSETETLAEHAAMFARRTRKPRPGTKLYLGRPDFIAQVEAVGSDDSACAPYGAKELDLGWLPFDHSYDDDSGQAYFHAVARAGAIEIPAANAEDLFA